MRSVSSLPILAMLTFDEQVPRPSPGSRPKEAAERLRELGVAAIGANHGAGIQAALAALSEMGDNGLPLAAMPNIGLASMAGNRIIYPHASPEYFAEFAAHARSLGARVIGGCCGTTPTEIAAIASAVKEEREPSAPLVFAEREDRRRPEQREETELARKFRESEWVVSVQIDPPLGGELRGHARGLAGAEGVGLVGFVDINDNATARAASALMLAVEIERSLRDRDDPAPDDARRDDHGPRVAAPRRARLRHAQRARGDRRPARGRRLPRLARRLRGRLDRPHRADDAPERGEDYNGQSIDAPTSFFIGVAVNPAADDLDAELERFERKLEAGAQFAMTQIIFDLEYMDALRRPSRRQVADPAASSGSSRCGATSSPFGSTTSYRA